MSDRVAEIEPRARREACRRGQRGARAILDWHSYRDKAEQKLLAVKVVTPWFLLQNSAVRYRVRRERRKIQGVKRPLAVAFYHRCQEGLPLAVQCIGTRDPGSR